MAKILIIEERVDLANLVRSHLEYDEHTVETVYSGNDAQRKIQDCEFDLIIVNWELPEVSGIDILKRLRSSGDSTPVIMLAAKGALIDKEMVLDEGADDCLSKPFDMTDLGTRVKKLLQTSTVTVPQSGTTDSAPSNSTDAGNLLGSILDQKYELTELIGGGGTGNVYKANHCLLSNVVAVKMLFPHMVSRQLAVRRFHQEARSAASLSHPNILKVIDFGTGGQGQPYLVMEYLEGLSLADLLEKEDAPGTALVTEIIIQACAGISHAHGKGVIHRDIKPSNLMLIGDVPTKFTVKIVDFGLAKPNRKDERMSKITVTGEVFGSPAYMSPEQCRGEAVDHRADVYSMGCVLYEALAGRPPFVGKDAIDVIFKHVSPDPAIYTVIGDNKRLNEQIEKILRFSLEKNKEQRYQSIEAMFEDLSQFQEILKSSPTGVRVETQAG